jgi:hypothetical protein
MGIMAAKASHLHWFIAAMNCVLSKVGNIQIVVMEKL